MEYSGDHRTMGAPDSHGELTDGYGADSQVLDGGDASNGDRDEERDED
jgi:hypothetical protein